MTDFIPCPTCIAIIGGPDSEWTTQKAADLQAHLRTVHADDPGAQDILARSEHIDQWTVGWAARVEDHEANPIVQALEDYDPADDPKAGLGSVYDPQSDQAPAWAVGFCEHLVECEFDTQMADMGIEGLPDAIRHLVDTAFWGGVYAERNRLLTEVTR